MVRPQMAAQGFSAKPAFETHDIIGLQRSADRHRRHQGGRGRRRFGTTKPAQRLMYRRNQSLYLIDWDTVFGDIIADNLGNQVRVYFL